MFINKRMPQYLCIEKGHTALYSVDMLLLK